MSVAHFFHYLAFFSRGRPCLYCTLIQVLKGVRVVRTTYPGQKKAIDRSKSERRGREAVRTKPGSWARTTPPLLSYTPPLLMPTPPQHHHSPVQCHPFSTASPLSPFQSSSSQGRWASRHYKGLANVEQPIFSALGSAEEQEAERERARVVCERERGGVGTLQFKKTIGLPVLRLALQPWGWE